MKILVISNTEWNDNNSFGNSFSNIFGGGNYEIANVSCQGGMPSTDVCQHFFQITEKGIINSILHKSPSGKEVFIENASSEPVIKQESKVRTKAKVYRWQILFWLRDLIWATGKWRSKELDKFVLDFNPDVIVLPVYYSTYLNNIGVYVTKLTNKPVVGYISDDCYTFKQFSLSPLYWIDRLIKRKYVKKGIDLCKVLYTITDKQKKEYNQIFGNKCKVLYKGGDFSSSSNVKTELNSPIKLVYTGNIGSGRWKTLASIGDVLEKTNGKAELIIYSQTILSSKDLNRLTRNKAVKFMGGIHFSKVKPIQQDADILVHVESFELKERYSARLSFSTKVVDYLEASRCILAVGWKETGAIEYLSENDGAVVITSNNELENKIIELISNPYLIQDYGRKGSELGKKNHQIDLIRNGLYETLLNL